MNPIQKIVRRGELAGAVVGSADQVACRGRDIGGLVQTDDSHIAETVIVESRSERQAFAIAHDLVALVEGVGEDRRIPAPTPSGIYVGGRAPDVCGRGRSPRSRFVLLHLV